MMTRMAKRLIMNIRYHVVFLLLLLAPALIAQGPSAEWRTIETEHFRVHFPAGYEAWAVHAASRLESVREIVSKEVGYAPPQRVDLLIGNPIADANGSAWPLLDTPRMVFFAEAPGPEEQIGAYASWIELLSVHEYAHLAHLMRPSRNPLERLLEKTVFPLAPITRNSPRWVDEGYATVIEGKLTGAGRPSSTLRALILRRWAQSGRLPSYGQLNSDRRFLGMSMAYLMGSAYLEWLEQRGGPDAFRNLWARMTARQKRSFDQAFEGVFGEKPDRLYGRFVAEVTASAMTIDRARPLREGELFQETNWTSGEMAVAPDAKQLAIVLRSMQKPDRLVIWYTEPANEEEKKYEERLKKILGRDPEDVAPIRIKPLPRKAKHELTMPDGGDIRLPRWTRDGKAVVFAHRVRDEEGFLHHDLYRWTPAGGDLTRITRLADVRDADPLPDGTNAVAVRGRFGQTQLVTVNLLTGEVTPRTEPSIDIVQTHPRASADGRIAHIEHRGGRWVLIVDGAPIAIPEGDVTSFEWLDHDTVVAGIASGGFAELYRIELDGTSTPLTSSAGGAFAPAPASDGRIFFNSIEPDGFVVRVLAPDAPRPSAPFAYDAVLVPALPPAPSTPAALEARGVAPARPYGLGRQEWSWLTGQNYARDQAAFEVGIRLGDVVGRLDTLAIASFAREDAPDGFAIASSWRGLPVELSAHLFHTDDDDGGELRATWTHLFPQSALQLEGGVLASEYPFANAVFSTYQLFGGSSRLEELVRAEVDDDHWRAMGQLAFRSEPFHIAARYQADRGANVALGGLRSSILPRSFYARCIVDPALPVATLRGEHYDGWRIDTRVRSLPFNVFYQRHELDGAELSLAGIELELNMDPFPLLGFPGLDMTLGAARLLDSSETNWWVNMRWRP
jgi:hypothetical protein